MKTKKGSGAPEVPLHELRALLRRVVREMESIGPLIVARTKAGPLELYRWETKVGQYECARVLVEAVRSEISNTG